MDDEARICEAVERALERIGYQVESSPSAMDALEKIHKGSFDLVICDIRMPAMDGMALLDRIKEYDSSILVLMITGYASIDSAVEAVKKGAQEYIPKPFSPGQIRFLVERAFERRRLVEEWSSTCSAASVAAPARLPAKPRTTPATARTVRATTGLTS